jgi:hypothetical protein
MGLRNELEPKERWRLEEAAGRELIVSCLAEFCPESQVELSGWIVVC